MKNILTMFEELWVAIAFAEEGIYEPGNTIDLQPDCQDAVQSHVV